MALLLSHEKTCRMIFELWLQLLPVSRVLSVAQFAEMIDVLNDTGWERC